MVRLSWLRCLRVFADVDGAWVDPAAMAGRGAWISDAPIEEQQRHCQMQAVSLSETQG